MTSQFSKKPKTSKPSKSVDDEESRLRAAQKKKEKEKQEWDREASRIDRETNEAAGVTGPPPDGATKEEWDDWAVSKLTAIYSRPTLSNIWTQLEEGQGELRAMRSVVPRQTDNVLNRLFRGDSDHEQPAQKPKGTKARPKGLQTKPISPRESSQLLNSHETSNKLLRREQNMTPTKSRMPPPDQKGYSDSSDSGVLQSPALPLDDSDGPNGRSEGHQQPKRDNSPHGDGSGNWIPPEQGQEKNRALPSTEEPDHQEPRNGGSSRSHVEQELNNQPKRHSITSHSSSDNGTTSSQFGGEGGGASDKPPPKGGTKKRRRNLVDDLETSLGEAWDPRVDRDGHRPKRGSS